jgi:hypothetical protein
MNIYESLEMLLAHPHTELKMESFGDGWIDITISNYGDELVRKTVKPESNIKNILRRMVVKTLEDKRWS